VCRVAAAYNARVPVPVYPRTREELTGLMGDLPIEWPGVIPVTQWRPSFQEAPGRPADLLAAVSRLPAPGDHYRRNAELELAAQPHQPAHPTADDQ
jgi:hypothetical protein